MSMYAQRIYRLYGPSQQLSSIDLVPSVDSVLLANIFKTLPKSISPCFIPQIAFRGSVWKVTIKTLDHEI